MSRFVVGSGSLLGSGGRDGWTSLGILRKQRVIGRGSVTWYFANMKMMCLAVRGIIQDEKLLHYS